MNAENRIFDFNKSHAKLGTLFENQRQAFMADPFPDLATRLGRLNDLATLLDDFEVRIIDAIDADFGQRATVETRLSDLLTVRMALAQARKHLKQWMRARKVGTHMLFRPGKSVIQPQPLGVVGVIAPWNFPLQLVLSPVITALAAGNRVIAKPSEFTPRFSAVLAEAVAAHFEPEVFAIAEGQSEIAQAMTELPLDHLVFTGSTAVGRKVAMSAARNLTPVTLELGGKSPAIIDESADIARAARRIVRGKLTNAGQICVAPDYLLLPVAQRDEIVQHLLNAGRKMLPHLTDNPDITTIINDRHFDRLTGLIEDARAKGATVHQPLEESASRGHRTFPLTILTDVTEDMRVMQEEIFGPILPVVGIASHADAIRYVADRDRPLALYWFGTDKRRQEDILTKLHAGGMTINDTLLHAVQEHLPFGGVGASGMGNYHGKDGFERLSHMKAVFKQVKMTGTDMLSAPFTRSKQRMVSLTEWLGRR